MNDRFLSLLTSRNWQFRARQMPVYYDPNRIVTDYVKSYQLEHGGVMCEIAVAARFYGLDEDQFPARADIFFAAPGPIHPSNANRITSLRGKDRIICTLDHAGLLTALKYLIYAHPAGHFKQHSKTILGE